MHIKRHLMKDLPESDDAVAQWCKDTFVAKVFTRKFHFNFFCSHCIVTVSTEKMSNLQAQGFCTFRSVVHRVVLYKISLFF